MLGHFRAENNRTKTNANKNKNGRGETEKKTRPAVREGLCVFEFERGCLIGIGAVYSCCDVDVTVHCQMMMLFLSLSAENSRLHFVEVLVYLPCVSVKRVPPKHLPSSC